MNNAFAFIYARTDSHRLPGKIFLEIGGHKVIDIVYARAKRLNVDQVIILTTDRNIDDSLVEYCSQRKYTFFRGHSSDLVRRTLQAIYTYKPGIMVRINGDSPLIEPVLVNAGLNYIGAEYDDETERPDMVSNIVNRTFPYGISVECIRAIAYTRLAAEAAPKEREHVTQHLYRLSDRLSLHSMTDGDGNHSQQRLALDTSVDAELMTRLRSNHDILTTSYWEMLDITPPTPVFSPYK
jgi:spore coat polysaccharide biosynthesis protein SpsF